MRRRLPCITRRPRGRRRYSRLPSWRDHNRQVVLEQIVYNLIDNAVKYRAPDRPIEICARTRRSPSGQVTIAIEDNGRGIAESDRERVFELFRCSGEQDISGQGIGLGYARTLVCNLGE